MIEKKSKINISVIIPCYNCSETIRRCLNSIPDNRRIEIIAVDDCSDDNTLELLKLHKNKLKYSKMQIILNKINQGAGETRNIGINAANMDYIVFLDSDDYFVSSFYKTINAYMKDDMPDCIVFDTIYMEGKKHTKIHMFFSKKICSGKVDRKEAFVYIRGCVWGKIYKRSVILENKVKFADLPISEDLVFSKCAFLCAKNIYYIDKPLYVYTYRENSLVHSGEYLSIENDLKAYMEIEKFANGQYLEEINSIYFLEVVYASTMTCLKQKKDSGICKRHFKMVMSKYKLPDRYFKGYALRYKFCYILFQLQLFSLFKIII